MMYGAYTILFSVLIMIVSWVLGYNMGVRSVIKDLQNAKLIRKISKGRR